jgi:hypothetical protein
MFRTFFLRYRRGRPLPPRAFTLPQNAPQWLAVRCFAKPFEVGVETHLRVPC